MKKILVNEQYCPKNHPCPSVRFCPKGAIYQDSMFDAPAIDEEKCTSCGICTNTCRVFQWAEA